MKFAKELEQELVPEWRIKYLNYKAGKKYVKAVARAISRASATPVLRRSGDFVPRATPSTNLFAAGSPFGAGHHKKQKQQGTASPGSAAGGEEGGEEAAASLRSSPAPPGRSRATPLAGERQGLTQSPQSQRQYGSIRPTPRLRSPSVVTDASGRAFALPAPAIRVPSHEAKSTTSSTAVAFPVQASPQRSLSMAVDYRPDDNATAMPSRAATIGRAPTFAASPYAGGTRTQRLRRLFSMAVPSPDGTGSGGGGESKDDIGLRALDEVREREMEFFRFLDAELDKVESFYKLKEAQAGRRLAVLREQLHEMRNRRVVEIQAAKRTGASVVLSPGGSDDEGQGQGERVVRFFFKPGPNSKALQKMPETPHLGDVRDERRDYIRRADSHSIPYRTAKHKLKLALQEFYRGLELLKAYALLNRTAFRKLNKKFDKAVGARPPYRYMNEKVNRSWFVTSSVVDELIVAVEDLYARYFERGNHKVAAGKLRALTRHGGGDQSASAFRSGLLVGLGAVFAVQGVVGAAQRLLHADDPQMRTRTSYLLQIYGGYFLMLYLFALFCLDCRAWTRSKINYPFIFEFDPRSHVDWRTLAQFPSFFFLVLGLFLYLNFSDAARPAFYIYYPVLLIGLSVLLLFLPLPTLWHRSRRWFLYSHWRLFFAGLYPVEFRDFFLGDIYCSLTYCTSNIELFFCLYAHHWTNPGQCNSNSSRLLGFFSALPPVWRALQCLRRYRDTRNVFPHLVNCGKYVMTILSAVCLSLYRIERSHTHLALFIALSTLNSIYTSVWDLFMDFSLLQPDAPHVGLRDILALKRRWLYYAIMTADPLLRFSWIFYAIFTHNTQHSTLVSFFVSFAEASRRGMWALLRVENEHCANVAQYKASRDVPLPYRLHEEEEEDADDGRVFLPSVGHATGVDGAGTPSLAGAAAPGPGKPPMGTPSVAATATESAIEEGAAAATPRLGTLRRRRTSTAGRKSIAVIMAEAHKQDFEKKRKPEAGGGSTAGGPGGPAGAMEDVPSSDDDDDAGDEEDAARENEELEEEAAARELVEERPYEERRR